MINLRYHIVSLIAVFLALGVGILVGTTVLDAATVSALEGQLGQLRSNLQDARVQIDRLRSSERLTTSLSSWIIPDRFSDEQVLEIADTQNSRWGNGVREGLTAAGARTAGSLRLTDRWGLTDPEDIQKVRTIVGEMVGPEVTDAEFARATLEIVGSRLFDEEGRALVMSLAEAGFLTLEGGDLQDAWPAPGTLVVVYASTFDEDAPTPVWTAALARGTGAVTPTLVVSAAPAQHNAVRELRDGGAPPAQLATFDSADAEFGDDFVRVASVLALDAAKRQQAGHYGTGTDRVVPEGP